MLGSFGGIQVFGDLRPGEPGGFNLSFPSRFRFHYGMSAAGRGIAGTCKLLRKLGYTAQKFTVNELWRALRLATEGDENGS